MNKTAYKSDGLLLLTAMIWGFAFVAQRLGMDHVGPFTFNGIRFFLGALSLCPILLLNNNKPGRRRPISSSGIGYPLIWGGVSGLCLYAGASLQQAGLVYTTAGKAGFITGLYVVIVPIIGIFIREKTDMGTWIGAVLATAGLYFLCVTEAFTMSFGDFLVLSSAFFWAVHVLLIGRLSNKIDPLYLAFLQYTACAALSLVTALIVEVITMDNVLRAAGPLFYGGVLSVGIAYTLQIVAQQHAHPAHAAILLSLEAVFAVIGGWMFIDETLTLRGMFGCVLMLSGMLASQIRLFFTPVFDSDK